MARIVIEYTDNVMARIYAAFGKDGNPVTLGQVTDILKEIIQRRVKEYESTIEANKKIAIIEKEIW